MRLGASRAMPMPAPSSSANTQEISEIRTVTRMAAAIQSPYGACHRMDQSRPVVGIGPDLRRYAGGQAFIATRARRRSVIGNGVRLFGPKYFANNASHSPSAHIRTMVRSAMRLNLE